MTYEEKSAAVRLIATAIVIAEYGLLRLVDNTHHEFKHRVKNAINSCRKVQDFFISHPDATEKTKELFREQFLSGEIVLLSELLETCFGIKEDGLEEIINAIKQSQHEPQKD